MTWALHLRSLSLPLLLGNVAVSLLWGVWGNWVFPKCFEILCKEVLLQEPQVLLTDFLLSALKSWCCPWGLGKVFTLEGLPRP